MSRRDDRVALQHVLDHSLEAVELTAGKRRQDLEDERLLQLALVRLVEIVGEAAGRVSADTQGRHPAIPWPQIISMRNVSSEDGGSLAAENADLAERDGVPAAETSGFPGWPAGWRGEDACSQGGGTSRTTDRTGRLSGIGGCRAPTHRGQSWIGVGGARRE